VSGEKRFKGFRDTWNAYRFPTDARYLRKKWSNLSQALRSRGSLTLPEGVPLAFDSQNKRARFDLLLMSLIDGVLFHDAGTEGWRLDAGRGSLTTPQGVKLSIDSFSRTVFAETFLYDVHFIDFEGRGRLVVEAGAFIGDTALYYASLGFNVVSLEPDVKNFAALRHNLSLNPELRERIVAVQAALGEDGEVMFPMTGTAAGSVFRSAGLERARSLSIRSVLADHSASRPYLLHLDVKGLEFGLLDQAEVALFDRVRLEFTTDIEGRHLGNLPELMDKLRKHGFRHLRVYKHNFGPYPLSEHGTIDAEK